MNQAREIQRKRYQEEAIYSNAALIPRLIEKYCKLDEESKKILEIALEKLGLSARAYGCILKVASVRLGTLV